MNKHYATMDGNEAAANRAYPFTEIAAIYPITPSSPMAGKTDAWSAKGRKNCFGQQVTLTEMQSEAGAIGAVHGAAQAGALATSFTSSQGLMLMIPVLYRIAGERLPVVLHVASRTVGTHAMSIFGDHSDVMACRQTGFALMSTASVQEVADLAPVAHLAAIEGRVPFMHFFDGFRTSHEINKVELIDEQAYIDMMDTASLKDYKDKALNPEHPDLRNTVQNGDVYFQVREAHNGFYDAIPGIVEKYFDQISQLTGREYKLFNYYGAEDAEEIIIAMGSVSGAVCEAVDSLRKKGRKVGYVQVHLYRPFSVKHLLDAIPATVKKIAVLDRCKEMGAFGEPLYEDVVTSLSHSRKDIDVYGGRYGLSSKDTDPSQLVAVFENLAQEQPKNHFTIGIVDDVTFTSLPLKPFKSEDTDTVQCKFWGLGGDGTVGANHNTVAIINETTPKYGQAYFEYDAKKSFGITKSHLRFSSKPIAASYYVKQADFIAVHNQRFITEYDIVEEVKEGGILLLNCSWSKDELEANIPARVRRQIAEKGINFYTINATAIAAKLGLGSHTNTVLQSAFFALMQVIPVEEALKEMKEAARRTYFAKGDEVVNKNIAAIDAGAQSTEKVEIPASWFTAEDAPAEEDNLPAVVKNILFPVNKQKGDDLPVSAFKGYEDGRIDLGLTAFEKRGIAVKVPQWDATKCLQCNMCSFVCPHAAIRPYLMNEEEAAAAPEGFTTVAAKGKGTEGMKYTLQVSAFDCTGCGSCAASCIAKDKALTMVPVELGQKQKETWNYGLTISDKGDIFDPYTIKGSQFRQPLIEFSAACAGCGETPYAKLLTQLFGDRVYWANATGCSQAWGGAMPGIPYTTNKKGFGPAWTNSLFENNAELALGLFLGVRQQRERQKMLVGAYAEKTGSQAANAWLNGYDDFEASPALTEALVAELAGAANEDAAEILERKDQLTKKCFWMFGGDGWAYDIGFGGLDHVIASGEDVNVFVIDTEVYSNTGGQSSKATPLGAVAQFASSGKKSGKKDLGAIFRSYGNVYVAQVAMGANPNQLIKAIHEAEAFHGPSIIVAYTPCTAHGIKAGMANVQAEMKRAVDAGYWLLYRYNPDQAKPLTIDNKAPSMAYEEFLDGETRYASLKRTFPANAEELFAKASDDAEKRYQSYVEQAGSV